MTAYEQLVIKMNFYEQLKAITDFDARVEFLKTVDIYDGHEKCFTQCFEDVKAFKQLGFMGAAECDERELESIYAHTRLRTIKDFDERLKYLATANIKANQSGCLTKHFNDAKDQDDPFAAALKVAQVFKDVAGLVLNEREKTECERKFMTIMDYFEDGTEVIDWLFGRAFKQLGFKKAAECDEDELRELYNQHGYGFSM